MLYEINKSHDTLSLSNGTDQSTSIREGTVIEIMLQEIQYKVTLELKSPYDKKHKITQETNSMNKEYKINDIYSMPSETIDVIYETMIVQKIFQR